jgi:hypothetical protein
MEQLITVVVQRQLTLRCRLSWHGFIHSTDNSRLFSQTDIMHSKRLIAALYAVSITALFGMTTPALADNLYCKIVTINNVASTGEPKRLTGKENIRKAAEGTDFTIDRSSGLMLGKFVENGSIYWDTTVVERGGVQMSYKAFSRNRQGYAFAQYIEVELWREGPRKPFVLLDNEILTGYCTL